MPVMGGVEAMLAIRAQQSQSGQSPALNWPILGTMMNQIDKAS